MDFILNEQQHRPCYTYACMIHPKAWPVVAAEVMHMADSHTQALLNLLSTPKCP